MSEPSESTNDINWVQPQINYIPDHDEPRKIAAHRPVHIDMSNVENMGFIKFDVPGYDCDLTFGIRRVEGEDDLIVVTRYDRGRYLNSKQYTLSAQEFADTIFKDESETHSTKGAG